MIDCLKRLNFTPKEFIQSETAERQGIDNSIKDPTVLANMVVTADKLQEIRFLLDEPMTNISGHRCLELNRAVGSRDTSRHILGQAADFQCWRFGNPEKIVKAMMEAKIVVDQCLIESNWVHVSIKPSYMQNRNEFAYFLDGKKRLIARTFSIF